MSLCGCAGLFSSALAEGPLGRLYYFAAVRDAAQILVHGLEILLKNCGRKHMT